MTIVSGYGYASEVDVTAWFKEQTERDPAALACLAGTALGHAELMTKQRQFRIIAHRGFEWVKREEWDELFELFPWRYITRYTIEFDDEVTGL
jgi:hypothetical protein